MDNNLKFKIFKLSARFNTFKFYQAVLYSIIIWLFFSSKNSSTLLSAIITSLILNYIFKVRKADGILLIKIFNTARISMEYCNYEHYTDRDMFNMLEKSINLIFNSDYIEKLKVKKIYIRTHSALANFIIKKLHQKNNIPYSKKLFKECVERGYIEINGHKVITKYYKSMSNKLLTSRVSNFSEISIKENSLKKKEHYKIIIPVELYYKQKLKA